MNLATKRSEPELSSKKKELMQRFINVLKRRIAFLKTQKWANKARANQLPPDGNWNKWLLLAGRGFGKTRSGAEAVNDYCSRGLYKDVAIIGNTLDDVYNVMIAGPSGIMNSACNVKFCKTSLTIRWPNGARVTGYSGHNIDKMRGPQFDLVWIDELAKFRNPDEVVRAAEMSLRLGTDPKMIITTTPRPIKCLVDMIADSTVAKTFGTTYDNSENLPKQYLDSLRKYENTSFGEQEIYSRVVANNQRITRNDIEIRSAPLLQNFDSIVLGFDPALSSREDNSEQGIVIAGSCKDKIFVLEDLSGNYAAQDVVDIIASAVERWSISTVVVETNVIGDFARYIFRDKISVNIKEVRAKRSKAQRIDGLVQIYKQKRIFHCEKFEHLENQMLLNSYSQKTKLDRLDSLAWAVSEIISGNKDTVWILC